MKSLYKLLFICILAITAISAGQFALYRINEQHTEIRKKVYDSYADELESLYKYTPEQALPDLRVYDKMSPAQRKMIDDMDNATNEW